MYVCLCATHMRYELIRMCIRPALVAQGVSTRRTGHILEALLPQGELRE